MPQYIACGSDTLVRRLPLTLILLLSADFVFDFDLVSDFNPALPLVWPCPPRPQPGIPKNQRQTRRTSVSAPHNLWNFRRFKSQVWGGRRGLNPQRPEPQSGALPIELLPPFLLDYSNWGESCQKGREGAVLNVQKSNSNAGQRRRTGIPWRAGGLSRAGSWCPQSPDASAGA